MSTSASPHHHLIQPVSIILSCTLTDVVGIIPIGISVPEVGTDNDYDLPYRIIKMAIEQPVC